MSMLLPSLTLLVALAASGEAGTLSTWEGEMIAERAEHNVGPKTITLTVFIADADADSTTYLWTLADEGRGGFPWTGRYGQWRVTRDGRTIRGAAPSLLFDHGEGLTEATIDLLFTRPADELREGVSWKQGSLEFTTGASGARDGREAWRVEVRGPYGPKGMLWFDRATGAAIAAAQRMTLGRGKPYGVQLKRTKSETLSEAQAAKIVAAFEQWLALRDTLKLEPDAREVSWSDEQLNVLKKDLPQAVAAAANTPLAEIAADAEEDLRLQNGRSGRVAAMRTKLLDRPAPHFELQGMRGEKLASTDLAGSVTVLHFWEYRDTPLEEPYGQVGYLDFLYRKHKAAGLKVVGVSVDERFADRNTRNQAISSTRKLQSFMNLSYPIYLDDGAMLKRFGDPRAAGGKLPLFVMIGADGKVLHYHAGFHEVDRDLGLKELDEAATKALKP